MTGPRNSTARQRERAAHKAEWERKKAVRFSDTVNSINDGGEPMPNQEQEARSLRGPEFVKALERAYDVTGDPVFDDALKAVIAFGLDKGGHKRIQAKTWGDPDE